MSIIFPPAAPRSSNISCPWACSLPWPFIAPTELISTPRWPFFNFVPWIPDPVVLFGIRMDVVRGFFWWFTTGAVKFCLLLHQSMPHGHKYDEVVFSCFFYCLSHFAYSFLYYWPISAWSVTSDLTRSRGKEGNVALIFAMSCVLGLQAQHPTSGRCRCGHGSNCPRNADFDVFFTMTMTVMIYFGYGAHTQVFSPLTTECYLLV